MIYINNGDNYSILQKIVEPDKITSIKELSNEELLSVNVDKKMSFYKYDKDKNKYELNYIYNSGEIIVDAIEINNKKIIFLTYTGEMTKVKCYDIINKKEKLLSYHLSNFWNNYKSMTLINEKTLAVAAYDAVVLINTHTASIIQMLDYVFKDFISVVEKIDDNTLIVYDGLISRKIDLWKEVNDGIWEKTNPLIEQIEISSFLKSSNGKIITGGNKIIFWNI